MHSFVCHKLFWLAFTPILAIACVQIDGRQNPDPIDSDGEVTPKRVVFIGGSITKGTGASSPENCWASLVARWLNAYYRQGAESKNIGVSGTTSEYGVYRLDRDLKQFVPDIAFIEFVMNDPADKDFVYTYVDALVYKLRMKNPAIQLVYVATTGKSFQNDILDGVSPAKVQLAKDICALNQVHFVDAGAGLWNAVLSRGDDIENYLPDGLHPNDAGHAIYAQTVQTALPAYLSQSQPPGIATSAFNGSDYGNATIEHTNIINETDCVQGGALLTCDQNQGFVLTFFGTSIGFSMMITGDGGQMDCVIDESDQINVDFWDKYALRFNREFYKVLRYSLSQGPHTLRCTVNSTIPADSNGQSTGHLTRIVGILVSQPQV